MIKTYFIFSLVSANYISHVVLATKSQRYVAVFIHFLPCYLNSSKSKFMFPWLADGFGTYQNFSNFS